MSISYVDRRNIGEVAVALRHGLDSWRRDMQLPEAEFWESCVKFYAELFESDYKSDFNPAQFKRIAGVGEDRYSR